MQESIADFEANDIGLLAISVDAPVMAARMRDARDLTYALLSDEDAATIKAYDVHHPLLNLALPAVFVLDSQGIVRWVQVGAGKEDRAPADAVLAAALAVAAGGIGTTPRAGRPAGTSAIPRAAVTARN